MAYATKTDLATWLGKAEADLSPDSQRLLERASELVDYLSMDRVDTTNTDMMANVVKAVCSQVEYWLSVGEVDIQAQPSSYSIGNFSIQYGGGDSSATKKDLSPRAKRYLFLAGLTYRGVGMR